MTDQKKTNPFSTFLKSLEKGDDPLTQALSMFHISASKAVWCDLWSVFPFLKKECKANTGSLLQGSLEKYLLDKGSSILPEYA